MSNNKVLINDTNLTNIANAIRTKNGSSNLYTIGDMATAIENIPSGSITIEEKDVNFRDYDGTLVASYTANEFASLSTLPDNPSHSGLTAQGWNWTLIDAKTYVATYGKLEIGQMYITDDGNTRIYIHLEEEDLETLFIGLCINGSVQIDWGDESALDTMNGSSLSTLIESSHQYNSVGNYMIEIIPDNNTEFTMIGMSNTSINSINTIYLSGSLFIHNKKTNSLNTYECLSSDKNIIQKIELGQNITKIGNSAFYYCTSLKSITIPSSITNIGNYAFYNCFSLKSITIPNGVTNIGGNTFYNCCSLKSVTIPNGVINIGGYAFYYCTSLKSITIPSSVTKIDGHTFCDCFSLKSIIIPNGVINIGGYAFYYCYSLKSITIPNSITKINNNTFTYCQLLESIIIPNNVTDIGNYAFQYCYSLKSITVPNSITKIGNNTFQYCCLLESITIPNSITNINNSTFEGCYITDFDFSTHTAIPTLTNTNAFSSIKGRIIVPDNLYEDWIVATNWATYADKIIKASEA